MNIVSTDSNSFVNFTENQLRIVFKIHRDNNSKIPVYAIHLNGINDTRGFLIIFFFHLYFVVFIT